MSDVEESNVPWSHAVVMVCTKCSKKIVGHDGIADDMKKDLKGELKELRGKAVRVVTSSCLDVCPKNRMALAIATRNNGTRAITVEAKIKTSALVAEILKTPGL
jgi:NADH:ubiquinone oxidoreductase subunit E